MIPANANSLRSFKELEKVSLIYKESSHYYGFFVIKAGTPGVIVGRFEIVTVEDLPKAVSSAQLFEATTSLNVWSVAKYPSTETAIGWSDRDSKEP